MQKNKTVSITVMYLSRKNHKMSNIGFSRVGHIYHLRQNRLGSIFDEH